MHIKPVYIAVAVDEKNGIGKDNTLPWHLKKELQHFKNVTTETEAPTKINAVIMGRNTWQSIPEKFRPLPARKNIVITSADRDETFRGADIVKSLEEGIELAELDENIEKIFIIGGGMVFEGSLHHPLLTGIYLTRIHHNFNCDTFFPNVPAIFDKDLKIGHEQEKDIDFDFHLYEKS